METIRSQVEFLETHAHCLCVNAVSANIREKYFIYDHFIYEKNITISSGFIVTYEKFKDNINHREIYLPTQISKARPDEIQMRVDAMVLKFGE